jgi:PucR C-terminal helix-turn-helix domain/GGDEF-like domain
LTALVTHDTLVVVASLTREAGDRVADADFAARRELLGPLLERVDALAEQALIAMRAQLPAYASQGKQFHGDVRDQLQRNYTSVFTILIEGRELTAEDVSYQRAAAMRRARAGVVLEDYLRGYRIGQQVAWEAIVECAGDDLQQLRLALGFASELMRAVDYAANHAAQSYVDFRQHSLLDAARERRDLLEHLLEGRLPDGPLAAAADRYGLGADTPALVVVAMPIGPVGDEAPVLASASLARTGLQEATSLVVIRQSEIVAVLTLGRDRDPDEVVVRVERAQERLRADSTPMAIGVSTIAEGVAELPQAYREASAAVRFVGKDGGVAALSRLSPLDYMALRADATTYRLIDPRLLAGLREDRARGGVLIATIRAYAQADMRLKEAAAQLHIHPHTAQYRFQRVEELTGMNPRGFADLNTLIVAIALDDLRGSEA